MIALPRRGRRISPSRLLEFLRENEARSLVDPFMGIPMHLNVLKNHGIVVHGGDLIEWFVRAGEGLVANDSTILRDYEVAEIVELLPGRIYPTETFKAWEGEFFTEQQCRYLAVWHANVHSLRSDGQVGLAILGLWHVLCYWLQKTQNPDAMPDIEPSELAWDYVRMTERWVCENRQRNTVRHADWRTTLASARADAVFIHLPARDSHRVTDNRFWMWEAWWKGDPSFDLRRNYAQSTFCRPSPDDAGYASRLREVLAASEGYPLAIIQLEPANLELFASIAREVRTDVRILEPRDDEIYIIARG